MVSKHRQFGRNKSQVFRACQANDDNGEAMTTLKMTEMPKASSSKLAIDFFGPIDNEYIMISYDLYSRYPTNQLIFMAKSEWNGRKIYEKSRQSFANSQNPPNQLDTKIKRVFEELSCNVHATKKISPNKLLFRNADTSRLPHFVSDFKPNSIDKQAILNDQIGKTKMKSGDEKHRVKEVRFNIADQVLLKQKRTNKSLSHYDPVPSVPR